MKIDTNNISAVTLDITSSGIAHLVINRPEKHNAFDDRIIQSLIDGIESLNKQSDVRALVLRSEGKNFSAGADLGWMQRMVNLTKSENQADAEQLASLMHKLYNLPIPTLVAVQGAAFGGAIGLIACCDIAIAEEDSRFSLSEVKIGLAPATISPYVVKAMGARQCKKLFVTAELFSAQQALNWGLIHDIVPKGELTRKINDITQQLQCNSPAAMKAAKELVKQVDQKPIDAQLISHTSELIAELRVSPEGQEGLNAFLTKRPPYWHPEYQSLAAKDSNHD